MRYGLRFLLLMLSMLLLPGLSGVNAEERTPLLDEADLTYLKEVQADMERLAPILRIEIRNAISQFGPGRELFELDRYMSQAKLAVDRILQIYARPNPREIRVRLYATELRRHSKVMNIRLEHIRDRLEILDQALDPDKPEEAKMIERNELFIDNLEHYTEQLAEVSALLSRRLER